MSPGNMKELSITDEVFIGGVKSDHSRSEVTSKGFHGCVQGVTLGTALRKLKDNEEARGIIEGCSLSVRRVQRGGMKEWMGGTRCRLKDSFDKFCDRIWRILWFAFRFRIGYNHFWFSSIIG